MTAAVEEEGGRGGITEDEKICAGDEADEEDNNAKASTAFHSALNV